MPGVKYRVVRILREDATWTELRSVFGDDLSRRGILVFQIAGEADRCE